MSKKKGHSGKRYSQDFKETVVLEYYRGQASVEELCNRYGIRSKSTVYKWIKAYSYDADKDNLVAFPKQGKSAQEKSDRATEERIKELEKAIFDARMQAEAYRILLDLGKEQFGIDLEKDFGDEHNND